MHNQIGFKDYEIIKHNNDDREDKLTIKTSKGSTELTNLYTEINLIGLELTKRTHLNQEGVLSSNISGIFEQVDHHDLIVLGKEFDERFHTKLSIQQESDDSKDWIERSLESKRNLQIGDYELQPYEKINSTFEEKPICNSMFHCFFSDDIIHPMNELILSVYVKKDIYELLSMYIEKDLIDKIQINVGSERIFRQDSFLPEYKDEDRYLLFSNDKYKGGGFFSYTEISFETKKRINEDNYKEDFEKKDEERERIIIKETKEKNYENKFNFMIGLLIAITIILFLK